MIDPKIFDSLAQKVGKILPPGLGEMQKDVEKNIKQLLQNALSELGLVSREEFDIQAKVLSKTREKLEALKKQVTELENSQQKNT